MYTDTRQSKKGKENVLRGENHTGDSLRCENTHTILRNTKLMNVTLLPNPIGLILGNFQIY